MLFAEERYWNSGFYRLGSTKFYRNIYAGVGGVQRAESRTEAAALDKSPRDGLLAFYADHYVVPLPEGHRFPMTKLASPSCRIIHVSSNDEYIKGEPINWLRVVVRDTLHRQLDDLVNTEIPI